MSSHADPPQRSSNVDLITLAIAAVASGVAAYVTSKLWAGGTLISAAMTPVIVALVKEGIARPVDVTTRRVRDLTTGQTIEVEVPRDDPDAPFDPLAPVTPPPPTELQPGVTLHRDTRARKPWKIALITGLLAFVIAAAVITIPQVIANGGSSGGGGGGGTTYFGGGSSKKKDSDSKTKDEKDATPTPEATKTAEPDEEATPSATPSATETPEATPTPEATTTATPSATPSATASPTVVP